MALLPLLLTACGGGGGLTTTEEPAVAISHVDGPLVGGRAGALIDAVDARAPRTGSLRVAAARQYDPITGQTTDHPISVYVTASDALGVDSVELSLDGVSMGTYLDSDGQAFKNPFIFPAPRSSYASVPISGSPVGLVESQLRALASDVTGQVGEAAVLTVEADGSRPDITFSTSGDGPPYTGPVVLTGQAADPETGIRSFSAFLNGEAIEVNPATPDSFSVRREDLTAGTQTVRLVAVNGVLVPNEAEFTFQVAEETEGGSGGGGGGGGTANQDPVVSLLAAPTEGEPPLAVSFTASASDPDGDGVTYLYNFGDGVTTAGAPAASHTYTEAGTYTATVTVDDGNGGRASSSATITVGGGGGGGGGGTDNEAPTVSLSATPTSGDAPLTVALTADAEDGDGDALSYTWDFGNGKTAPSGAEQTVTYEEGGTYTARVTVTDDSGGEATAEAKITVGSGEDDGGGTPAPTITSFTADPATITSGQSSTLSWEVDGAPTAVTISPDVGDVSADDGQVTVSPTETTTYTISAMNEAGSATKTVEVTVTAGGGDDNQAPKVSLEASPTEGAPPLTVTFDAAATDPDGDALEYRWFFGDGKRAFSGARQTYTYAEVGTYTASVVVVDGKGGKAKAEVEITVGEGGTPGDPTPGDPGNQPPVVTLTAVPTEGDAPLEVTFTAAATDPEGDALSYVWNFGDNDNATGDTTQTHTYTVAASYVVSVTVTDGRGGKAIVEVVITVN